MVLSSVEAWICPKPACLGLYMRFQDMFVAKMTWPGSRHEAFKFCKHQSTSFWLEDMYGNDTDQSQFHSNCEACNTDYEIGWLRNEEFRNITIVGTRWISLGPGLSPDDPRWRMNAYCETWSGLHPILESEERGPSPRCILKHWLVLLLMLWFRTISPTSRKTGIGPRWYKFLTCLPGVYGRGRLGKCLVDTWDWFLRWDNQDMYVIIARISCTLMTLIYFYIDIRYLF